MSNQVVGAVYAQIIERVITASQNDFEEFGVDSATLAEMKQVWQEKLSALKVAAFPWDPQQEPPRPQQLPTVPSNAGIKQEPDVGPSVSAPPQQEPVNFPNVSIKSERGVYESSISSYPQHVPVNDNITSGLNGNIAQQRAQALIAQRIGQPGYNMPMPPHGGQAQMHGQQRMIPGQAQQQRPPQQMQQRPGNVYASQTDGADGAYEDWNALVSARAAEGDNGSNGRIAADHFMRAQVDAMAARQDSGLMVPLDEMPKGKRRKAAIRVLQAQRAQEASSSGTSSLPDVAPFDGELDAEDVKEENDDDAINSDLDDPEDDIDGDGDNDDEMVDYMLCTYDKVQRVKNKWKCTLKDGILTTGKKEYLFHKANADLEF
ncbi:transcription factor IIA, alpha/beta subunit [Zopfia rhizophila CBS 207.26]|uniref:Transcription factor IIA, alpha/beta subunit n=1 Tax=Zopfia rhizophila CBS 207.26 TaxID=1314779 RepID=A0A6A6DUT3_9PEZI|nr:transcription factor IIA, alpha/beta subunit [Zopfia rhizophila CBS 207.26]